MSGERLKFDWGLLVPDLIHPLRVEIIEAMTYVDVPLSATDLRKLLGYEDERLSMISYHVRELHRIGTLAYVRQRQVRGSVEKFYRLRVR